MDAGDLRIRPFEPDDLAALQEIRGAAFAPVFKSFRDIVGPAIASVALTSEEAEQAALLDRLCDPETPDQVFVAVVVGDGDGSRIAGFVALSMDLGKRLGEVGLNAVDPKFQGRGVGTALYRFALQKMRDAGMEAAAVGTGGDPSHAAARRAYEKAGFGPSIPSVWMYRTL